MDAETPGATMLMQCFLENRHGIFVDVLRRIEDSIGKAQTDRFLERIKMGIKLNAIGDDFDTFFTKVKNLFKEGAATFNFQRYEKEKEKREKEYGYSYGFSSYYLSARVNIQRLGWLREYTVYA